MCPSPPSTPSAEPLCASPPSTPVPHKRRRTELPEDNKCPTLTPMQPSSAPLDLRDAVRAVQKLERSHTRRAERIHQLFAERRQKAARRAEPSARQGVFPGIGARRGCSHYERNCWIKAKCCGRYYPCRRCHDEAEDHEIDRHATEQVACVVCGDEDQPVAERCRSCNVLFAKYFCRVCVFYDDTKGREAYHCDGCGICRVGKGLGIDNHHCDGCSSCVPIAAKDTHPCRERSLDANCPICTHYLATSTEPVVFLRCGHTMHVECLSQHTATRFTCPICNKCLTDMREWYKELDERIARDVIPSEYASKVSRVLCHDCGEKTVVRFHFVYHKCGAANCGGYNTRVLEQYDDPGRVAELLARSTPIPSLPASSAGSSSSRFSNAQHVEEATT